MRTRLFFVAAVIGLPSVLVHCGSDSASAPVTPTPEGGAFDAGDSGSPGTDGATGQDSATPDVGTDSPGDAPCTALALRFVSTTDNVTIPDSPSLSFGGEGTIEAWFIKEEAGKDGFLFNKWEFAAEDKLLGVMNGLIVGFTFPVGNGFLAGATAVPVGKWTHAAFVFSAAGSTVFRDGVADGTSTAMGSPGNSNAPARIGGIFRDGSQFAPMRGFIADVRISDIARYTATFVPPRKLATDANTKAHWKLDEGTGTTANDASGNANTGTITGATWAPVACR